MPAAALLTASTMTTATARGCESVATWLDVSVVVVAWMCAAIARSYSGAIMRSFTITNHDGFVFQAAVVILSLSALEFKGPCVK